MATQTTPPKDPAPSAPPPPKGNRFFDWMRGLDLPREPGWIGGVCAGIAARLGIDPLIVRGIVVVVAVLGGPALILYAAAWLLLPDAKDKIHLEELFRGRLESPIAGIGALVLLSLLPIAQGFWSTNAFFWGEPSWGASFGRVAWTLVVLAGVIALVVWIARRSSSADPTIIPATTDDRPETIPQPTATATVLEPEPPAAGAPEEEFAAWRARQEEWKAEREQFRSTAAESAQAAARERTREAHERHRAAAAARAESRRARRAANPRAGAAYGAIALGTAALAGAAAALASTANSATIGLAVSAIVIGAAIALAGILRRRSGFLVFVSVLLLIAALLSAIIPTNRVALGGNDRVSNVVTDSLLQPAGDLDITLRDPSSGGGDLDVVHGVGNVRVQLAPGVTARIIVASQSGDLWIDTDSIYSPLRGKQHREGAWRATQVFGTGPEPSVTLRIVQGAGSVIVQDPSSTPTNSETTP